MIGARPSSNATTNRCMNGSSCRTPGNRCSTGTGVSRPGTEPRTSAVPYDADLVLIGEHQSELVKVDPLGGLAALAGQWVSRVELDLVHELGARQPLEDGVHLTCLHGPA